MYRKTAETIRNCLANGIHCFTRLEWQKMSGFDKERNNDSCDLMVSRGIITGKPYHNKVVLYTFTLMGNGTTTVPSPDVIERLKRMCESDSRIDSRIGQFLLRVIERKTMFFTAVEWGTYFGISKWAYGDDIRHALNIGLIRKTSNLDSGKCIYAICDHIRMGARINDLTLTQKQYLARLYEHFADNEFTVEECAAAMGQQGSSAYFNLKNFTEREIIMQTGKTNQAIRYVLRITPESHPECFPDSKTKQSNTTRTKINKAAPLPLSAVAAV